MRRARILHLCIGQSFPQLIQLRLQYILENCCHQIGLTTYLKFQPLFFQRLAQRVYVIGATRNIVV